MNNQIQSYLNQNRNHIYYDACIECFNENGACLFFMLENNLSKNLTNFIAFSDIENTLDFSKRFVIIILQNISNIIDIRYEIKADGIEYIFINVYKFLARRQEMIDYYKNKGGYNE